MAESTKDILHQILVAGGCSPKYDEDGYTIINYKDNPIHIYPNEFFRCVALRDVNWHQISKFDTQEVVEAKKKVNAFNHRGGECITFHEEDDDTVKFCTTMYLPLSPATIRNNYFGSALDYLISIRSVLIPENTENSENTEN